MSKQAVVGILAHVDAGKTTLAEELEQRLIDEGKDIVIIKKAQIKSL